MKLGEKLTVITSIVATLDDSGHHISKLKLYQTYIHECPACCGQFSA